MGTKSILIGVALIPSLVGAQVSVEIGPSGTVEIASTTVLEISGNWTNTGVFTSGGGTVVFNGAVGNQVIANSAGELFFNVTIDKADGNVQLGKDIKVDGVLILTGGDLDLNGNVLTLGSNATVSETAGNTIGGSSGSVSATDVLNAPGSVNVGGLGAVLTSSANLGSTTVTRRHQVLSGGGNSSIARSYEIQPATNVGLNATLVFTYDESELNGLIENDLTLFRSTDAGNSWTPVGGVLDKDNNRLTIAGVGAFSLWTAAASSAPLPVSVEESTEELAPRVFTLSQSYPNPFNPTTTMRFTLPEDGRVRLKIYSVLGEEVATLVDEERKAGVYQQIVFDASRFATGVYVSRLEFGGKRLVKKMLLVK